MYIFTPADDLDWPHFLERLADELRRRNPDEFIDVEHIESGPGPHGPWMKFGITLDGEDFDGSARPDPPGVSLREATVEAAAFFCVWLHERVVAAGSRTTVNTRWGLEDDAPDVLLAAPGNLPQVKAQLEEHLINVADLDEE